MMIEMNDLRGGDTARRRREPSALPRRMRWAVLLLAPIAVFAARPASAIEAGINIDVHQDIDPMMFPILPPNDFHVSGRIESGTPFGNWNKPPVLVDHVDDLFPTFTYTIQPDLSDPQQNWYLFEADWSLPPGDPGIPFCTIIHLGLLFDLSCHNVVIDLVGYWTRDGQPIFAGFNQGFWPALGFRVDHVTGPVLPNGQFIRIQNGNMDGITQPGEIEVQVTQMDVVAIADREELHLLLGPEPFRELRLFGLQEGLPWVPVLPISELDPVPVPPDSFFDVFLQGGGPYFPETPVAIPPGGFLISREKSVFLGNSGMYEEHWIWEFHEAHASDLGDAPDSSNSWGVGMTTYPTNLPARFPTVFMAGSPPHGPIHWQPLAVAHLGPMVSTEFEADLMPDQDGAPNIDPPINAQDQDGFDDGVIQPLNLPHCQPTSFNYVVNMIAPAASPLYVNVWFDWNRDADWDDTMTCAGGTVAPEWAVQNQVLPALPPGLHVVATPQFVAWHPIVGPQPDPLWMRITLSEQPWQPSGAQGDGGSGPAAGYEYGETEDYLIEYYLAEGLDYGDAPDPSYPTLLANDGARHVIVPGVYLGASIDGEPDGQPDPAALGDDNNGIDDEDGVIFTSLLVQGQPATVDVIASVSGFMSAWVDFNGNGSWLDAGEQIFADQPLVAGLNSLAFNVPVTGASLATFARFRFTTGALALGVTGQAPDGEVEDYAVEIIYGEPVLLPKWQQPPHLPFEGFDAPSDVWMRQPQKWEQLPDPQWPGLHAHDYRFSPVDPLVTITLADDWICEGGELIDLHWWGNYEVDAFGNEIRGSGIAFFHISVHNSMMGLPWPLPMDPEIYGVDLAFAQVNETDTGLVNNEGCRIYRYDVILPEPFFQVIGTPYFLDIEAHAVDPLAPALWRWQEARRDIAPPLGMAPAASRTTVEFQPPGPWSSIEWLPIPPGDQPRYSDMAFRLTMGGGPQITEPNKVVADDFISDGRPINAVRWWGSYLDERYVPDVGDEIHQLDGWFISFHWAEVNANPDGPPDLALDPPPTALGIYFAPADAVRMEFMGYTDCLGHLVYEYVVDLRRCCLICSHSDPRVPNGTYPAQPDAFHEMHHFRYWLDIQAVTGIQWVPGLIPEECVIEYTGHLPSDLPENDGHFWGWHTSPIPRLAEACTGRIVDMSPYPPNCWEYGDWVKQPWLCTTPPEPVNMSFELLTTAVRGDCNGDGVVDLVDYAVFAGCMTGPNLGPIGAGCGCIDLDVDDDVDLRDFAEFMIIFK